MSGAKETPRQKMIGMMYLVYTALLAMNVSKDILDAFDTVNAGVQTTNITLSNQISQKYAAFEEQYGLDQEKVGPYWEQAQALREEATEFINYVEALKWDLVKKVELSKATTDEEAIQMAVNENGLLKSSNTTLNGRTIYDINTSKVKSRDGYNQPTEIMMGNPEGPGNGGLAYELSERMKHFRNQVIKAAGPEHLQQIGLITDSIFGTKDYLLANGYSENQLKKLPYPGEYYGAKISYYPGSTDMVQDSWEYHNFHHTVLVADVTLLNKIISEAETAELNECYHSIDDQHSRPRLHLR